MTATARETSGDILIECAKNCEILKSGSKLIIIMDLDHEGFGLSSTKKTEIVGTTSGPKPLQKRAGEKYVGYSISATLFRKPRPEPTASEKLTAAVKKKRRKKGKVK